VTVTEQIVLRPEMLTVAQIEAEPNSEVRRVMLERFTLERYVREGDVEKVAQDNYGTIWRRGELHMLEVINATPEADGTFKHYVEFFNPRAYNGAAARIPQAANASMWRYRNRDGSAGQPVFADYHEYHPSFES
jgi:hypothetical protein